MHWIICNIIYFSGSQNFVFFVKCHEEIFTVIGETGNIFSFTIQSPFAFHLTSHGCCNMRGSLDREVNVILSPLKETEQKKIKSIFKFLVPKKKFFLVDFCQCWPMLGIIGMLNEQEKILTWKIYFLFYNFMSLMFYLFYF